MPTLTYRDETSDSWDSAQNASKDASKLASLTAPLVETAYVWDMTNDAIRWEANVTDVLGIESATVIATGSAFRDLIVPEHVALRADAIGGTVGDATDGGVPFKVQFKFMPDGKRSHRSLWVEDCGRCWLGLDGRPARARGTLRVIGEENTDVRQALDLREQDELTGQLNRRRLLDALRTTVTTATDKHQPAAFLIAGVNNLSIVNDTFGFQIGDEVISAVGRLIKERTRGGDTIGRYGSNLFGIIVNDCGPTAMRAAAERFMAGVRDATIRTSVCSLSASVSIGGVIIPSQAVTAEDAVAHALQALEQARRRKFDSFAAYEPSVLREAARKQNIRLADELLSAIQEQRLSLALQPIVCAKTLEPHYYECLLRLTRHDGVTVSAGEFIRVGEQLGLVRLIDRRALELAMPLLHNNPGLSLSLNVSAMTCQDHDWLVTLHRLLAGRRDLAARLMIEITETAMMADLDQSTTFVDMIKDLGCQVAIDDFGAGYTSFKTLKHLPVDVIKIDGGFVRNLAADPVDRVFVQTMADLAKAFNIKTVAEWVVDAETVKICAAAGITYLQGYHVGEPMPASSYRPNQSARPVAPTPALKLA